MSISYFDYWGMVLSFVGSFWIYQTTFQTPFFAHPLIGLVYFPFWGLGLYIVKIAYDEVNEQKMDKYEYARKVAIVGVIQFLLILAYGLIGGGNPQPIVMPLPIAGLAAILLRRFTVREISAPWESEATEAFT
jgi:hypothetical protein